MGFPDGSDGKESAYSAGDSGWEDLLEEGMATHSSILAWKIPTDRGACWATVHGVTESDATETEQQQNAEGSDSQSDGSLDLP